MKSTVARVGMFLVGWSLLLMVTANATAQETKKPEGQPAAKPSADNPPEVKAKGARKAPRGRLPNYYTQVVDEEQRERIYAIQAQYNVKINELLQQVVELTNERNTKVEAVLTPEQLQEVRKITDEVKSRRKTGNANIASTKSES